jgi:hypothetical protein
MRQTFRRKGSTVARDSVHKHLESTPARPNLAATMHTPSFRGYMRGRRSITFVDSPSCDAGTELLAHGGLAAWTRY